jgi:hypothetical protein
MDVIAAIEAMSDRLARAKTILARSAVHHVVDESDHFEDYWAVEGDPARGRVYQVSTQGCNCADGREGGAAPRGWCKHKLAVQLHKQAERRWELKNQATPPMRQRRAA